ncbi:TonB-dependent receptor [Niabella terrae]
MIFLLLISSLAFGQSRMVKGRVTDASDGAPLSAVTVTVQGSQTAASTDAEGNYSIQVPDTYQVLEFSYVGYTTQTRTIDGPVLDVSLTAAVAALENIVVIGYGTVRKKDLTGSVAVVSSKDFNKGQSTTPEQLIAGKVPGVQITSNSGAPGAGSTIRIRGGASLNASNDPLIVIDGVPIDNGTISGISNPLATINPNDIETFNILKDASATAIYGSRASNGVIIITTKKGKRGKPVVNFNTQFLVSRLPKYADVLGADAFRTFVQENGDADATALLGDASTNWQEEIFRTGISSDNNLSVSGAAAKGALPYRVSLGYLKQQGVLKTSDLDRYSAGINLSPSFLDNHLKIDLNLKASQADTRFANESAIAAAVNFDPTQPVYSGSSRYNGYYEWLDAGSVNGLKQLAPRNPLALLMDRHDNARTFRSIGNIQFDYKFHFLPDLRANLNLGYDYAHSHGHIVVDDSAAQSYQRFQGKSGINNEYGYYRDNGLVEFYLNYQKELGLHRLDVTAGYGYYDFVTRLINYPDYTRDGTMVSTPTYGFDKPRYTLISYYGRVNYSFNEKYLLTAALRTDGSSKFNPDNRWGLFPSAAFAWRISQEAFLKNSAVVSDLKLRLGYGITGQQDGIDYYDYLPYYTLSSETAQYQLGDGFYQMYRPDGYYYNRTWEQTTTYNAGLDYGFFSNRINGSIDFYYKKTRDLLNEVNQPGGTNFTNKIVANIGSMENKGVEFALNTIPVQTTDFTWNLNVNATYNQNTITNLTIVDDPSYPGAATGGISGGVGNLIQIHSVGFPRSAFYVLQQVYDDQHQPLEGVFVDQNNDNLINEKDFYRYKNPDPDVFLGMNTGIIYKRFSAGFGMRANIGNYVYNNVISATGTRSNIINPLGYLNNGSADVLSTGFAGTGDKFVFSDYFVENASFLRMDNAYIGYDFGKVFGGTGNLRLNANLQNVFVITKYKGLDPEVASGIDNNFYPRPRVFGLGLNLDF